MKFNSGIILLSAIFIIVGCSKTSSVYEQKILAEREEKNLNLKLGGPASPIPKELRTDFKGLKYFDVDSTFRVMAIFEKLQQPDSIMMATSKGEIRKGFKVANASFTIHDTNLSLPVYVIQNGRGILDSSSYFIPFTDLTTGKESYNNGRYLDIHGPFTDGQSFLLDFNVAYNPYCNYSDAYSCPIPPKESFINYAITAGEKNFH